MADNIVTKDVVKDFSILDAGIIAVAKVTSEELLMRVPFVGNGTIKSGLIKVVGAGLLSMAWKNKYYQLALAGILIDGAEDLYLGVKNYVKGKTSGQSDSNGLSEDM